MTITFIELYINAYICNAYASKHKHVTSMLVTVGTSLQMMGQRLTSIVLRLVFLVMRRHAAVFSVYISVFIIMRNKNESKKLL